MVGMGSAFEYEGRLLSRPVKVIWDGWETDTYKLQQNGWELSVDQDVMSRCMRMVIRNQTQGFIGQTNAISMELLRAGDLAFEPRHVWQMRHLGRSISVHGDVNLPLQYANFKPIDAKPYLSFDQVHSLDDLVPFANTPLVRSQALILPEAQVDDLLAAILDRQQDAKSAHFDDLARQGMKPKFHAQIISLSDHRNAA